MTLGLQFTGLLGVFMTSKYNNVERVGGNLPLLVCIIPIMGEMVYFRKNNSAMGSFKRGNFKALSQ